MSDSNALTRLSDEVTGLITKKAISRAKSMVQKYNGETDSILFSEGLVQTREILLVIRSMGLTLGSVEANLILDEFKTRWIEMDHIIQKSRGKRPIPVWTRDDRMVYTQIKQITASIFGPELPIGNVVPLLLEAGREADG